MNRNRSSLPPGRTITDEDAEAIAARVAAKMLAARESPACDIEPGAVYTVAQAAAALNLHPKTLRGKLRCQILKGKKVGQWRLKGSELLKLA